MIYATMEDLHDAIYKRFDWPFITVTNGDKVVAVIERPRNGKYVVTVYKGGQRTKETRTPYMFVRRNS